MPHDKYINMHRKLGKYTKRMQRTNSFDRTVVRRHTCTYYMLEEKRNGYSHLSSIASVLGGFQYVEDTVNSSPSLVVASDRHIVTPQKIDVYKNNEGKTLFKTIIRSIHLSYEYGYASRECRHHFCATLLQYRKNAFLDSFCVVLRHTLKCIEFCNTD